MKDSFPSLFIYLFMALTFESTHEYYLKDACVWFSEDLNSLIIVDGDHEDRVVVGGINKDSLLRMAQEIVKKSREKEVTPKKKTTSTK